MIKKFRKYIIAVWLTLLVSFGIYILFHPEILNPAYLLSVFRGFGSWAIILYIIVSMFRSIIFLPSLPLVIVGILYAPDHPHIVYIISMCGIWFSGILIYHFSHLLGFDALYSRNVHNSKLKKAIEKYGAFIISFWSFFPILPIDVICYVAGTVRLSFTKFIIALTIGEGLIVGIIIYGGREILTLFGI